MTLHQKMARQEMQRRGVRKERISRGFTRILRCMLVAIAFKIIFRLKVENRDVLKQISPPYIIFCNHVNNWDPFLIGTYIGPPIHFVTSDAHFRRPLLRLVLNLFGCIPKPKFVSDFETVRNIIRTKESGGIVGIFPEGRRSWDGHTDASTLAGGKLIKLLKVPVVVVHLKGSYLTLPRWTKRLRRGRILMSFQLALDRKEIMKLSPDEISCKLSALMEYDEFEFQRKSMIPYNGKKRAEFLELALFICPHCHEIGRLKSEGNIFQCQNCRYTLMYNRYGFFVKKSERIYFDSIRDWNLWQLSYLKEYLEQRLKAGDDIQIFIDKQASIYRAKKGKPLRELSTGDLVLSPQAMIIRLSEERQIRFPILEIEGLNVQKNERLEFYHRGILYKVIFADQKISSYKWMTSINILRELCD